MMPLVRPAGVFALLLVSMLVLASYASSPGTPDSSSRFVRPNNNPLAKRASDDFYNMDYDKSIREFETLAKEHPDDPFATNYLLSAVLFKELNRIGALDTESYANDSFMDRKPLRPLDPAARARIVELESRAEAQANALLVKNPDDTDALYARGVARGMRCTYMGMGEKAWLSALKAAIGARRDHERVLELNPDYIDAKMIIGLHNYVIGSLSWPVRMSASIVGIGGNRKKGLEMLRQVASGGSLSSMDAKITLALFLRREQRYDEALVLVQGMTTAYPHSFMMAVEYANLLNAAGRGPEAIVAYRQILANCKEKKYPYPEPAKAAFGLGISLRGQRRFQEAAEVFDLAGTFPGAEPEQSGRATLAAGEMYDVLQKRDQAVKRYQTVISAGDNAGYVEIARKHMKSAYQFP